jgi:hypothetical protein
MRGVVWEASILSGTERTAYAQVYRSQSAIELWSNQKNFRIATVMVFTMRALCQSQQQYLEKHLEEKIFRLWSVLLPITTPNTG